REITLPLLRPGLLTGFALVFMTVMKELPLTLLLSPTGFDTLATRIWSATEEALFPQAAAPALVLVALSGIFVGVMLKQEEEDVFE
ncbi:MAG: iron ABC transporter permease, partial [Kiritimatiellia bacterium]